MMPHGGEFEQFVLAADAIERWAYAAPAGSRLVYARGADLPRGAGARRAGALAEAGLLSLVQTPAVSGAREFVATRTRAPLACAVAAAPRLVRRRILQPDERRVLDVVRRALRRGVACPGYSALARQADVGDRQRARYLLRKLAEKGRIAIGPGRVVTLVGEAR